MDYSLDVFKDFDCILKDISLLLTAGICINPLMDCLSHMLNKSCETLYAKFFLSNLIDFLQVRNDYIPRSIDFM